VGNWLSQVITVSGFSMRTIPQRRGSSAAAVFGIAGVVLVLVGVLSIGQGFVAAMNASAEQDAAIVMRTGADTEMTSSIGRDQARIIADAPGVARAEGAALASAELFVIINLPKRETGTDANVPMRGVESSAFTVRSQFEIIEGSSFTPGRNELIVGVGAAREFAGLDVGNRIQIGADEWLVTGIFTCGGSVDESEIWCDAGLLQTAYRRGSSFQSVKVRLESEAAYGDFKDALTTDPRLNVKVMRQADYYAEQSEMIYNLITFLGTLIAGMMAVGAIFGAINTMYSAVSTRTREIATLRALGFSGGPVVISVLFESLLLALFGGTIGATAAYLAFDGFRTTTLNWSSFSQVAFAFDVTPALLIVGIVCASIIGLFGGLFPAVRAARIPIAAALREP